ncbi:hypothetical protein [Myxosarcina sp. GI1(2024)]
MKFSQLKKLASKLKQSGYLNVKITGKGVTKKSLMKTVEDILIAQPDAARVLT